MTADKLVVLPVVTLPPDFTRTVREWQKSQAQILSAAMPGFKVIAGIQEMLAATIAPQLEAIRQSQALWTRNFTETFRQLRFLALPPNVLGALSSGESGADGVDPDAGGSELGRPGFGQQHESGPQYQVNGIFLDAQGPLLGGGESG
jgi:hypothetical protein